MNKMDKHSADQLAHLEADCLCIAGELVASGFDLTTETDLVGRPMEETFLRAVFGVLRQKREASI